MAVHAQAGIKLLGATLTPFGDETFLPGIWNRGREGYRVACHQRLPTSGVLDGVMAFGQALHDPVSPPQMRSLYDCGDGLHPSDLGYCQMGDAIALALFDDTKPHATLNNAGGVP